MNALLNALPTASGTVLSLPPAVAALLTLLLGLLLALLLRRLAVRTLDTARFNALCSRTGISEFLRKGNVPHSPGRLTALLLSWGVVLVAVLVALHLVGLGLVATMATRLEAALPALITGVCVLVLGYAIVAFTANVIRTVARNAASPYADLYAGAVRWLGILLILGVAVEQVGMETKLISAVLQIVLAAAAFGLALAFGLGCKDLARETAQHVLQNLRERHRQAGSDMEG